MGVFSNLKKIKLNPWYSVQCDLENNTIKLPVKLDDDPYPHIKLANMLFIDGDEAHLLARVKTEEEATEIASKHMVSYMETREGEDGR